MKSWFTIAVAVIGLAVASPVMPEPDNSITPVPANPLVPRARQVTGIYSCSWPSPGGGNFYYVLDPGVNVCDPPGGMVNVQELKVGQNFYFYSYGTRCRFFVDQDWATAARGTAFGHADCPGMKDIKGLKRDGVLWNSGDGMDIRHAACATTPLIPLPRQIYCYSRIKFEWDGCLSCGSPI